MKPPSKHAEKLADELFGYCNSGRRHNLVEAENGALIVSRRRLPVKKTRQRSLVVRFLLWRDRVNRSIDSLPRVNEHWDAYTTLKVRRDHRRGEQYPLHASLVESVNRVAAALVRRGHAADVSVAPHPGGQGIVLKAETPKGGELLAYFVELFGPRR